MFQLTAFFPQRKIYKQEIVRIYSKYSDSLNEGLKDTEIFADFSKAFGTVDSNMLLKLLQYYGVRGNALLLPRSYLKNRKQKVAVKTKEGQILIELGLYYMQSSSSVSSGTFIINSFLQNRLSTRMTQIRSSTDGIQITLLETLTI